VQNRNSKVSARIKKVLDSLTSAEKGNLITVVTCMNATGTSLTVSTRKNMKQELVDKAGKLNFGLTSKWLDLDRYVY
jgi:hypothetical protein